MILNLKFIREFITNNQKEQLEHNGKVSTQYDPVPYRWTHGATEYSLGDGLLIYSIIHYMRARIYTSYYDPSKIRFIRFRYF